MSDLAADAEGSRAGKIALRSRMLTARRHMTVNDRRAAAGRLQDQTLSFVRRQSPSVIAAYVPVGSEPGSLALLEALPGRVLLPVLMPDDDLDWAVFGGPADFMGPSDGPLVAGPRGLLEPSGPRLGPDAIRSAQLLLVPALAVDRQGRRMGRGGGSYDRALARLAGTSAMIMALLHDGELVDEVPAEEHDIPVHGVISPTGVTVLNPAAEWTK